MIRIKKKFLFILLALVVLYAIWLLYHLLSAHTYESLSPHDPLEIEGVYHVHTTLSDGKATPDEAARIAAESGLDFLIITDHGLPNHESRARQGKKQGIMVLAGSELSVNRGHLVVLSAAPFPSAFSRSAEEAVLQANASGGFAIIAHPYSKVQWSWGSSLNISGLEIISADSILRKNFMRMLPFLPAFPIKSRLPLLRLLTKPDKNLLKWDSLNRKGTVYGYFSTDAHLLYRPLFFYLRLHIRLERPLAADFTGASRQIHQALKKGRFYNAVDAAAQARGFRFRAESRSGSTPMGGSTAFSPDLRLIIQTPAGPSRQTLLIHNGRPIQLGKEQNIRFRPEAAGTYRVEVYLTEKSPLSGDCPWILSNPIFIRENHHENH